MRFNYTQIMSEINLFVVNLHYNSRADEKRKEKKMAANIYIFGVVLLIHLRLFVKENDSRKKCAPIKVYCIY